MIKINTPFAAKKKKRTKVKNTGKGKTKEKKCLLILLYRNCPNNPYRARANNADLDQRTPNSASDQGLHCKPLPSF